MVILTKVIDERLLDPRVKDLGESVLVEVDEEADGDFHQEDEDEDEDVGLEQTRVLPQRPDAAQEGKQEDDAAHNDEAVHGVQV